MHKAIAFGCIAISAALRASSRRPKQPKSWNPKQPLYAAPWRVRRPFNTPIPKQPRSPAYCTFQLTTR